jgi:predicted RNase H-related nuclease YkuK (DUF458 family)
MRLDSIWDGWSDISGKAIFDVRGRTLRRFKEGYMVTVGSDSKTYGRKTIMVTTLCYRNPIKRDGVIVNYKRDIIPCYPDLRGQLYGETIRSLVLANAVDALTGIPPAVHVDVNPKEGYRSNSYHDEIVGLVRGCNFETQSKPLAWAADIADMFT